MTGVPTPIDPAKATARSARAVVEQRVIAASALTGALAFAVVAAAEGRTGGIVGSVGLGMLLGVIQYLLHRRVMARALGYGAPSRAHEPEQPMQSGWRALLATVGSLVVLSAGSAAVGTAAFGLMFATALSVDGLLSSRWLRQWERRHAASILRARRSDWPYPNMRDLYASSASASD